MYPPNPHSIRRILLNECTDTQFIDRVVSEMSNSPKISLKRRILKVALAGNIEGQMLKYISHRRNRENGRGSRECKMAMGKI